MSEVSHHLDHTVKGQAGSFDRQLPACRYLISASELEARRELQVARRAHRRDRAVAGLVSRLRSEVGRSRRAQSAIEGRVDGVELRVVERIECVKAELHFNPLFEPEALRQRQ